MLVGLVLYGKYVSSEQRSGSIALTAVRVKDVGRPAPRVKPAKPLGEEETHCSQ